MIISELWEIMVPCVSNEGKPFRTRHHREWDKQIRRLSGGLTIFPPAKGQWISSEGTLFAERMIPVRIACDRLIMMKVAKTTIRHYNQLAVMFYKVSEECIIVEKENELRK